MAFTQEDKDKMDVAAGEAEQELEVLPSDALAEVARWWNKWYLKAGHKRLARILLQYTPEEVAT